MDELSLRLEDTLSSMRPGDVCVVSPIPPGLLAAETPPSGTASISATLHLRSFERDKEVWEMSDGELLSLARRHKERGTQLFREGSFRAAAVCYSRSVRFVIPVQPDGPSREERGALRVALLLNLAACQLKLYLSPQALENCSRVLASRPDCTKALYRRGVACMNVGDLEQAWEDLQAAHRAEPSSQPVRECLEEVARRRRIRDTKLGNALKCIFRGE